MILRALIYAYLLVKWMYLAYLVATACSLLDHEFFGGSECTIWGGEALLWATMFYDLRKQFPLESSTNT